MNNLKDVKIVYKKPNEYDNATLSMYSNYTNDTNSQENNELQLGNISEEKIKDNIINNSNNNNYSESEIDEIVLNIKKNILEYKSKEDVIKYIDKFFELNKFNDDNKNKILIKLNKIITEQTKNLINNTNINSSTNQTINQTINHNNVIDNKIHNKNDEKNIFGLGLNYWFSLSIFIIILLFFIRKK